jgi:hypothetical protein
VALASACACLVASSLVCRAMSGKTRTKNDHFDIRAMCDELAKYAKLKNCGWDWELSYYSKTRRSQGPDHAGLIRYVKLLGVLLVFMPNACPLPLQIKEVWLYLQRQYNIMSPALKATGKSEDAWAMDGANTLCVAFHHLRGYKTSQTSFMSPEVMALVEKIPSSQASSPSIPPKRPLPQSPSETRKIAKRDSDSSCQICSCICKCPDCCQPIAMDVDDEDDDIGSDTSKAAAENQEIALLKRFKKK